MVCKGACESHKAKRVHGINRYVMGQKHCSICDIFIWWDGRHCPCCNYMLRTKPRNTKNRRQIQEILTIQRI